MSVTRYQHESCIDDDFHSLFDLVEAIKKYRYHGFPLMEADKKIINQSLPVFDDASDHFIKLQVTLLAKLSAKLTLQQLDDALRSMEARDLSKRITDQDSDLLKTLFSEHFRRTEHSPLSYTSNPHALINNILIDLARAVDRLTGQKTPWLKWLIPSLSDEAACGFSNDKFRFKNVVLSEDNQTFVSVDVVKNPQAFEGLPPRERERVLSQSPKARALVFHRSQSAEFPLVTASPSEGPLLTSKSEPMAIRRVRLFNDEAPVSEEDSLSAEVDVWLLDPAASPVISVDTASLLALQAKLSASLKSVFLDKADLCQFMLTHLEDRKQWGNFIDCLDEGVLKAWFLPAVGVMDRFFTSSVAVFCSEDEQFAKWFCANAIYRKQRAACPSEYTGFFQSAANSKSAKLKAAGLVLDLIKGGHGFRDIYAELIKPEHALIYQSLTTGSLGQINGTFLMIAKDQYELELNAKNFAKL